VQTCDLPIYLDHQEETDPSKSFPEVWVGERLGVVREPDEDRATDQLLSEQADDDRVHDRRDEHQNKDQHEGADERPGHPVPLGSSHTHWWCGYLLSRCGHLRLSSHWAFSANMFT